VSDVLRRHLDAFEAQIALLTGQVAAMRHALETPQTPRATPSREYPARCAGVSEAQCALRDDDARHSRASFGDPRAWACAGCGHNGSGVVRE
jgi:hypothetical protein